MNTKEKPLPWISSLILHTHNRALWIHYKMKTQSSFRILSQTSLSGPFGTIQSHCKGVCLCVHVSAVQLSTVAQGSVGFVEFLGVAGFVVLLGASLPKVLSLNCERICC